MATTIRNDLWRVNFRGNRPGGEIFEHGFWMTFNTGTTALQVAATCQLGFTAYWNSPSTSTPPDFKHMFSDLAYSAVYVRPYNAATGLPTAPGTTVALTGGTATGVTNALPYQVAEVVTLWNGITVGRHRYNRSYLPPMDSAVLNVDGQMFVTVPFDIVNAVKAMDTAMGVAANPGGINVYSPSIHVVTAADFARCDQVFDTQRRRDNAIARSFTDTPLP